MIVHGLRCAAPRAGVDLVRVRPVDRDRHGAGLVVDEQHLLPRLAAVLRAVDAAIGSPAERIADRRDVRDVGILRMDLQLADLPDVLQARRTATSCRRRSTCTRRARGSRSIGSLRCRCRRRRCSGFESATSIAPIDPVGIWPSETGVQRDAVVLGLPDAAAGRAHVEHVGLRAHAGRRRHAAAAERADRPPAQSW